MATPEKIKSLKERSERYEYTGKYTDLQTFGNSYKGKRYSDYEKDPYNKHQNFLYKRALFGLKVYDPKEIKTMHPDKKKRIKKVNARAQSELNIWKQEKFIEITNKLFSLFTHSRLCTDLVNLYSEPDPKFISRTNFKDLGINKSDIINRLIKKKVLPYNFEELTNES
jgi:anaerobic selenocysteine-containing dehydrogenase